jgi:hypothetical protein
MVQIRKWVFRGFCVCIGLVSLLILAVWSRDTSAFLHRATKVQGTAMANEERANDEGKQFYYPKIAYPASDGHTYTLAPDTGSRPADYHEGQAVSVLYDPAKPEDARIDSFWGLWLVPVVCGPVALAMLVLWLLAPRLTTESLKMDIFGFEIEL